MDSRGVPARSIIACTLVGLACVFASVLSPSLVFAFLVNASGATMLFVYSLVVVAAIRMGIGGGFILVPAMLYILGIGVNVVVGTSLFQILFVTMATTMMHALTTRAVDIVLAVLLLIGSVSGAQVGAQFAQKAKPEHLRLILAVVVLAVAARMALGLGYRPDEIYTVVTQ